MKAIFKTTAGVCLGEKPKPELNTAFDVRIRIALAGLCRTDLYAAQGKIPVQDQTIIGHECAGFIETVSPQVNHLHEGQLVTVMPVFNHNHQHSMLGVDHDGVYADYVVVPASQVYPVPNSLSLQEAAFIEPIAACIAVTKAPIHKNQHGLIYGNNRIAELTKRLLFIRGFQNLEMGSPDVQNHANTYDFVIETQANEQAFEHMVQLVKPSGVMVLKSRPFAAIPLPIVEIVRKELHLVGVHYGDFAQCIQLLASNQLNVKDLLGSTYSFAEALSMLDGTQTLLEEKKIFFKP